MTKFVYKEVLPENGFTRIMEALFGKTPTRTFYVDGGSLPSGNQQLRGNLTNPINPIPANAISTENSLPITTESVIFIVTEQ